MRILLTGQNGYLGKKVSKELKKQGHEIFDWREDLFFDEKDACLDMIVNLAGKYERNGIKKEEIIKSNLLFGLELLSLAVQNNIPQFMTIDTALPKNFNLYSFSKKQLAEWGHFYCQKYQISFSNVILQMFYGEDEPHERFFVWCANKLKNNEDISLTEGTQCRDVIYIEDVVNALTYIINHQPDGYSELQVGTGEAPQIRESIEYLKKISQSQSRLLWGDREARQDEPDCVADLSRLNALGWKNQYTWKQGMDKFWMCFSKDND